MILLKIQEGYFKKEQKWSCRESNPGPKRHIVQVSTCIVTVLSFTWSLAR